jgi:hypothetical protein
MNYEPTCEAGQTRLDLTGVGGSAAKHAVAKTTEDVCDKATKKMA